MIEQEYKEVIVALKNEIKKTQYQTMLQVNRQLIELYYKVGKELTERSTWGNKFIEHVSIDLKMEFPNMKGFSVRNLKYMKKFYQEYSGNKKVQQLVAQIPWSHNIILIEKVKNKQIRFWYMEKCIENGWSRNTLSFQIETDLYNRQAQCDKLTNFSSTLSSYRSELALQTLKDPYVFDFITLTEDYKEKELERIMIQKMKNLLLELGDGFSFVGNQYKVTVGEKEYFIDLLFYHLKLRCYVVIELKTKAFKPEYIGKLNFYLSVIDDQLKKEEDNQTLGIILCKQKDKFTVEYALKDINKPLGVSSYIITKKLSGEFMKSLPSEEEINLHLGLDDIIE